MPALIDHAARRQHIIDATLDLVLTGGFAAVSLRKVATAAELNIGSVRHCFANRDALLIATAEEVGRRMGTRLAGRSAQCDSTATLRELVCELLPLDDVRRRETVAIIELIIAARTEPVFAPVAEQMAQDLRDELSAALTRLGVEAPQETAGELSALISGLSLDAVTPHGRLQPAEMQTTLDHWLARLT